MGWGKQFGRLQWNAPGTRFFPFTFPSAFLLTLPLNLLLLIMVIAPSLAVAGVFQGAVAQAETAAFAAPPPSVAVPLPAAASLAAPLPSPPLSEPTLAASATSSASRISPPSPGVSSAAILVNAETGQVLYEYNPHRKRPPASTTKILTAIVAMEKGRLKDEVKVSPRAAAVTGANLNINPGDLLTLEQLIWGTLIVSGNDAATAVAEHVGGSVEGFASLMNGKAAEIGALSSNFANPHGQSHPAHFTTAYDLTLLARYAMEIPLFRKIVDSPGAVISWIKPAKQTARNNTNALLRTYSEVDGIKTGTTPSAGKCLVSSATRDGRRLIAVVLNSSDRWGQSARLLNYGFEAFRYEPLAAGGEQVATIPVQRGDLDYLPVVTEGRLEAAIERSRGVRPTLELSLPPLIQAPVKKGDRIGEMVALVDGLPAAGVPLLAAMDVGTTSPLESVLRGLRRWLGFLLKP
ncbi:MAG: D-alanyl-D-alanine carboxypeptidase [Firmicutes bacterium]|nr:D-alanyl-D-alanine carboxypeptidase [Bacillota bacterium]